MSLETAESTGVRVVALFEAAKGTMVIAAGLGLLSFLHRDAQPAAESIVRHLHLNPARHYPRVFIEAAARMTNSRLWLLACGAFAYSTLRFVEAYGLWRLRPWAEWLAIVSGGLYLPVEIYGLYRHISLVKAVILIGNAVVVAYLIHIRLASRAAHSSPSNS